METAPRRHGVGYHSTFGDESSMAMPGVTAGASVLAVSAAGAAAWFGSQALKSNRVAMTSAAVASAAVAASSGAFAYMVGTQQWGRLMGVLFRVAPGALLKQGANLQHSTIIGGIVARAMEQMNQASRFAMVAAADAGPGRTVVELGCADGQMLPLLAGLCAAPSGPSIGRVVGVEVSEETVEAARARLTSLPPGVEATAIVHKVGGGAPLPLPDESVDSVVHSHCIYFWEDLRAGAADVARVLRPGGKHAFVSAPKEVLKARAALPESTFRNWDPDQFIEEFVRAGLKLESAEPIEGSTVYHMRKPE